jgi:hypothetical protein
LFTNSLLENGPNNLKLSWQNTLKKVVWSDPQFKDCQPELDDEEDGGIGTQSNQKFAANFTSHSGCTSNKVKICGRWKLTQGRIVFIYIGVKKAYKDAKVCAAPCCGGLVKYALKIGLGEIITHQCLCMHVFPNITWRFTKGAKLCHIFGLAFLHVCMSSNPDIHVPDDIWL